MRVIKGRSPDAFNIRVRDAKAGRLDKKSGFLRSNADQMSAAETAYDEKTYGGKGKETLGWEAGCQCALPQSENVPCTVLDPCAGSGTTILAAKKLGRRSIGIDLSARYLELAKRRLQETSLPLGIKG